MATYHPPSSMPAPRAGQHASPMASALGTMGYFQPGTKVQVGGHRVVVEKYLSEGGFAHVYVVRVPGSNGSTTTAVLKRVAVPDKEALANMRTEVETMKKLKGHKHIVTYIDSHASQLKGGGYEVFLLMEYCDGGGLIDFMNTRLKDRLREPEILHIFSDAAEGVACMHYLKPPLLHRDLKVENILISGRPSSRIYKLCDFGSTAPPRPAASSVAEGKLIEDDVQRHTTLQYRSPEMIDVYRRQPIDEKSDIWALGVFLYKLCYYTTPFEEQGRMAILTAKFKYPAYPVFSDRLKKLVADMLSESPRDRPNIYQVLAEVCSMRGRPVPVKDIYSARTKSEVRSNQRLPSPVPNGTPTLVREPQPEITPMRRGRPTSSSKQSGTVTHQKSRDPFAALDSPSFATRSKAVEQLSSRFPPAEQFDILQSKRTPFDFEGSRVEKSSLRDKLSHALADEAFAVGAQETAKQGAPMPEPDQAAPRIARAVSVRKAKGVSPTRLQPAANRGTDKSLPAAPTASTASASNVEVTTSALKTLGFNDRPIWRVPSPSRSPLTADRPRPSSQLLERKALQSSARSSRPSMEGLRPPMVDIPRSIHRSRSADEPTLSPGRSGRMRLDSEVQSTAPRRSSNDDQLERNAKESAVEDPVTSDVDYLRDLEQESALPERSTHRRTSSRLTRLKHASMSSTPGGTKSMLAGKFGNAFKVFESGDSGMRGTSTNDEEREGTSEATNGRTVAGSPPTIMGDSALVETEELPPEMRRELERRRLSLEEKRVAEAGAAHRAGIASGARVGGSSRASAIRNRVQNLLDESTRAAPVRKTASGYGRYTVDEDETKGRPNQRPSSTSEINQPPSVRPKPATTQASLPANRTTLTEPLSKPLRPIGRPTAPPKPAVLQRRPADPTNVSTQPSAPDWHTDFDSRYPDLSLDLVESEIAGGQLPPRTTSLRVRDV